MSPTDVPKPGKKKTTGSPVNTDAQLTLGSLLTTVPPTSPEEEPSTPPPEPQVWTVSQLTRHLSGVLKADPVLGSPITLQAELSNVKKSSRGHIYLTLRDEQSAMSAVIWASTAKALRFDLEDGLEVFVTGVLDIYAPNGTYSLVLKKLEPVGVGALQLAFDQLKAKLEAEGLFEARHKKPLPVLPKRLGLITAHTGAVLHDMLRVIHRKYPGLHVILHPVAVQGAHAAAQIARAIQTMDALKTPLDVMIVARGGGSFEDLFCFSEEPVVRAIFNATTPIVTGIGHEPDYGLADAVADYSAATPTMAADMAVPDVVELSEQLTYAQSLLVEGLQRTVWTAEQQLDQAAGRFLDQAERLLERWDTQLITLKAQLNERMLGLLERYDQQLIHLAEGLDSVSPLKTLARGYAVVQDAATGLVIIEAASVKKGNILTIQVAKGILTAQSL